jgi:hypothetical protein
VFTNTTEAAMDMDTEEVEVEVEVMITMTKDSEISGVDSEEGSVEVLTVLGSLINEIRIKNETEIRIKNETGICSNFDPSIARMIIPT